ncbi:MAG: biosynthetic arginine decarboxylase [Thioalkalispiraceae bacterium]|jgi:arginine decarboxylase
MTNWSIHKSLATYNIDNWSAGYFAINDQGHLEARPHANTDKAGIDLYELACQFREQDIRLPVLVRFTDILEDRVAQLATSFNNAIAEDGYQGGYTPVYPIKVNQQHSVVEHLLNNPHHPIGLEAGSKPELMAVLGLMQRAEGIIVCNGYKDREYIRLALIGQQMGHRVFIVIEKLSELELVIRESQAMNICPNLGVRVRLASIGAGQWQNTGGEKSKFGLSASQVLSLIARLSDVDMLDSLSLLHFHLGSQLANIRDIQHGMHECARFYAELHQLGVDIRHVDVGGGLGIDYEGTQSRHTYSMNYSVQSYASNIVHILWDMCEKHGLKHPDIMTESGRAMTAHHAILITNVIDSERVPQVNQAEPPGQNAPAELQELWQAYQAMAQGVSEHKAIELYHDSVQALAEVHQLYARGLLNLSQRAYAEEIYFTTCQRVRDCIQSRHRAFHDVLDEINEKLADKYFCNFSLFQSMPDVWAIEQIFPVVPLHRLDEQPLRRGVIEDITCDSDGRIDLYVDGEGVEASLPLHDVNKGEEYLLGMFLVGAYQEILGDMHNLFGDTDSVHVALADNGEYQVSEVLQGDTVDAVLRYVHFNSQQLLDAYQQKLASSKLSDQGKQQLFEELEQGIRGYTYLED